MRAATPAAATRTLSAASNASSGALALSASPLFEWRSGAAVSRLDARLADWMDHTPEVGNNVACAMTCHTAMPAALVHAAVGSGSPALDRLRTAVDARVAGASTWSGVTPFYGAKGSAKDRESLATEAVLNAASLAAMDRVRGGEPATETLGAFDAMWSTMRADGGFDWLDFGLEPFEHGESVVGAAFAARAVGALPSGELRFTAEVSRLREYLSLRLAEPDTPLFDGALAVWSLGRIGGASAASERPQRARFVDAALVAQRPDGAWGWAGVGVVGKRGALDAADALPTAVLALGLCDADDARAIEARRRALSWLAAHQAADGAFPSSSPNRDRPFSNLVMSDAATGFAAIALTECAR